MLHQIQPQSQSSVSTKEYTCMDLNHRAQAVEMLSDTHCEHSTDNRVIVLYRLCYVILFIILQRNKTKLLAAYTICLYISQGAKCTQLPSQPTVTDTICRT